MNMTFSKSKNNNLSLAPKPASQTNSLSLSQFMGIILMAAGVMMVAFAVLTW